MHIFRLRSRAKPGMAEDIGARKHCNLLDCSVIHRLIGVCDKALFRHRRAVDIATQSFQFPGHIRVVHPFVEREPNYAPHLVAERLIAEHQRPQDEHFAILLRADCIRNLIEEPRADLSAQFPCPLWSDSCSRHDIPVVPAVPESGRCSMRWSVLSG